MFRYKLVIEYDGTNYAGWQKQDGRLTIQETLEDCVFNLTKEKVEVIASGRTDAGVHAINQVIHFDLSKEYKTETIIQGLNFYLGENGLRSLGLGRSWAITPKYQRLIDPSVMTKVKTVNYCKPDGTVIVTLWEAGDELPALYNK